MFDENNFVVDKIFSIKFCADCPSCHKGYELIKDEHGALTSPRYCPNCGFDIHNYKQEEAQKQQKEIENNKCYQLRYDMITADYCGIKKHPQEQMKLLGYKLIDSIPQSIADCWWFTVDKFIEPLPEYLHKIKYTIGQP